MGEVFWREQTRGQECESTNELTTPLGYKTSIDQSLMCLCSFTEERQKNLGCILGTRDLKVERNER